VQCHCLWPALCATWPHLVPVFISRLVLAVCGYWTDKRVLVTPPTTRCSVVRLGQSDLILPTFELHVSHLLGHDSEVSSSSYALADPLLMFRENSMWSGCEKPEQRKKNVVNTPHRHKKHSDISRMIRSVYSNSNTLLISQINNVYGCKCPKTRFHPTPTRTLTSRTRVLDSEFEDLRCDWTMHVLTSAGLETRRDRDLYMYINHQATRRYDTLPRSYTSPYHRPCIHLTRSTRCTPSARGCVAVMI
jgi:hypothetical protein